MDGQSLLQAVPASTGFHRGFLKSTVFGVGEKNGNLPVSSSWTAYLNTCCSDSPHRIVRAVSLPWSIVPALLCAQMGFKTLSLKGPSLVGLLSPALEESHPPCWWKAFGQHLQGLFSLGRHYKVMPSLQSTARRDCTPLRFYTMLCASRLAPSSPGMRA